MLGLESGRVRVVPHSDAWPALYAAEIARLTPLVSGVGIALEFEHTGSTAVAGLASKPIVDILAALSAETERSGAVAALSAAGYVHRGEQEVPGRDFFRRGEPRMYHLHLALRDSPFWLDHRAFRDWLRAHPADLAEYTALKLMLAARYPADREAYIVGKTAFVERVLLAARAAQSLATR